jgi:hypothetical protein
MLMAGRFSYSFCSMVKSCRPASVTTQEYLKNLVSPGCMIVVEQATCRVPVDPVSPIPMG